MSEARRLVCRASEYAAKLDQPAGAPPITHAAMIIHVFLRESQIGR